MPSRAMKWMTSVTKSSPSPRIVCVASAARRLTARTAGRSHPLGDALGIAREHDAALRAVLADQRGRRAHFDQPAVLDDGDAVAQPLRLLHQVRGEEHRRAAVPDVRDESPDRAAGLRIEPGRELVEEHDLGLVDQRERDEEALLLAAGERHEPGVALASSPSRVKSASVSTTRE